MAKKKAAKKKVAKKAITKKAAPSNLIEVGKPAAAIKLANQDGEIKQLKDYRSQWVILYFYPRDNTSGCTKQACQFRDSKKKLAKQDAVVIGISPDSESSHDRFARKFDLPFNLLADPDKKACQAYGVWQEKMNYGRKYMGVVRTTYLVDPKGKVAFRWDKVKVAEHDVAVLGKIAELSAK